MKNRLITSLIAALMLIAAIPTVRAAGYTDIEGHWGKEYIEQATELQFFKGVSETEFDPNGVMTRGMFVTVLGRLEGIDLEYWSSDSVPHFFDDVPTDAYCAPYIRWAVCNGITNGVGGNRFEPDAPVTREQMAKLVSFYVERKNHGLRDSDLIADTFSDQSEISDWAAESVDFLRSAGILNGIPCDNGELRFAPRNISSRAECAAVFCRLHDALIRSEESSALPTSLQLSDSSVSLKLGQTYTLYATVLPEEASEVSLIWYSSAPNIIEVDENGTVRCVGYGSAAVTVCTPNGLYATCEFLCGEDLASADESYAEKCIRIFGEVVDDPRMYYHRQAEDGSYNVDYDAARADMVAVAVQVWDFDASGKKVTKSMTVTVHRNIAPTVRAIFEEIYNGEEQFPIHSLGGFSAGGKSEHTIGCAIDINPNENYYYDPNTGKTVGDHWTPGEDPYSIPLDGEVARIFEKYGFRQGAYWNSGAKDYMHFSYFWT